jgi:N-formylglutamate amidohydrolase
MSDVYTLSRGDSPLLISVPHDGRRIPDEQRDRMTEQGLEIPDTDWHVAELYDFAGELGASLLRRRLLVRGSGRYGALSTIHVRG